MKLTNLKVSASAFAEPEPKPKPEPKIVAAPRWLDRIGMSLSALCVLHCIATPLALLILPLASAFANDEWFHRLMFVVLLPIAIYAFYSGVRQHGHQRVAWLGGVGLFIIGLGLLPETELVASAVTIVGSLCLVVAHLLNRRLCRRVCRITNPTQTCCYHESL